MFALLEHTAPDGVHWDLLIELPGQERLATWRLAENPLLPMDSIAAERIGDHRRLYLDYEGKLSGRRGSVRRLDRGAVRVTPVEGGGFLLRFEGALFRGAYALDVTLRRRGEP